MLDIASKKFGDKVTLHRGPAEDLPFDDNEFDSAFFFTSLEFTERPGKAIEEACRVAKDTLAREPREESVERCLIAPDQRRERIVITIQMPLD